MCYSTTDMQLVPALGLRALPFPVKWIWTGKATFTNRFGQERQHPQIGCSSVVPVYSPVAHASFFFVVLLCLHNMHHLTYQGAQIDLCVVLRNIIYNRAFIRKSNDFFIHTVALSLRVEKQLCNHYIC